MGRKKKKPVKPWCWYCNREFDDDKILAQHQRAKHFKCPFCHKKLYSGPGLTVHCVQVHKEKIDKIPEALPNRNSVDIDIYGMQGVPEDDLREHERLKRGDDNSKINENRSQEGTSQQQNRSSQNNNQFQQNPLAGNPAAMHAAMFHHALSMGAIPPGFPLPPNGMSLPPPGFPMPPHAFPGMLPPPPLNPGIPPPQSNFTFPPGMMPPTSVAGVPPPPMFPPPPPPLPASSLETPLSSSSMVPPPPPLSGVGHLIGIPPPSMAASLGRPPHVPSFHPPPPPPAAPATTLSSSSQVIENNKLEAPAEQESSAHRSQPTIYTKSNGDHSPREANPPPSTIAKPAIINTSSDGDDSQALKEEDNFIEIASLKARIMHPNIDLSLEELRLRLPKYQNYLRFKVIEENASNV